MLALLFLVTSLLCLNLYPIERNITGDVPNIMMVMHSMLVDGDVDLFNNFEEKQWHEIFHFEFAAQYYPGTHFPLRSVGLPLLMLPGFALAGPHGMVLWSMLLNALVCAGIGAAAIRVTRSVWIGSLFAIAVYGMTPFNFYQAYPYSDMWGGLVFFGCFLIIAFRIAGRDPSLGWNLFAVALACTAPWLHFKQLIPLALVGAILLFANRPRPIGRYLRLIGADAALGIVLMGFFLWWHTLHGVSLFNYREMGTYYGNYHEGLIGSLFDRQFGVFYPSPIILFGFLGLFRCLARGPRRVALIGLALIIPLYVYNAMHFYWWGGTAPTGRMALNWLYILFFFAALFFAHPTHWGWKALFALLAAVTIVNTHITWTAFHGFGMFNEYPNYLMPPSLGAYEFWGLSRLFDAYGINDHLPSVVMIEGKNLRTLIFTLTLIVALGLADNWSALRRRGLIRAWSVTLLAFVWVAAMSALYVYLYAHREPSREEIFIKFYGIHPDRFDPSAPPWEGEEGTKPPPHVNDLMMLQARIPARDGDHNRDGHVDVADLVMLQMMRGVGNEFTTDRDVQATVDLLLGRSP